MVTIYNYAFTMLGDCVVTVFELLNHIHNRKKGGMTFFWVFLEGGRSERREDGKVRTKKKREEKGEGEKMEKRGKRKEKQRGDDFEKRQGFIWMRVDHKFLPGFVLHGRKKAF